MKIISAYSNIIDSSIYIKNDPIVYFSKLQRNIIMPDRFGILSKYFQQPEMLAKTNDMEYVKSLPYYDIKTLIDNRCNELYAMSKEKDMPIYIMWSGRS